MLCFDCAVSDTGPWALPAAHVDAVAICCRCGAGVCEHHVVEREVHLTVPAAINREVPVNPPARRLLCQRCAAAEHAQHEGHSVHSAFAGLH